MNDTPGHVLIVDDNPEDLAVYSRWLAEGSEGRYRVSTASSLQSALAAYAYDRPDCVVLDHDLGESTGLEFMAELTRLGVRPAIVAITGSGSETIAVDFMKGGAGDYLKKSRMSARDLCAAVTAQLAKRAMRTQLEAYRERERIVHAQLAAALKRAAFLVEAGKRFAGPLGLEEALALAADGALPFLGDICVIDLWEQGVLRRRAVAVDGNSPRSETRDRLLMSEPDAARALGAGPSGGSPYLSGDAFTQAARTSADIGILEAAGCCGAAILPLRFAGEPVGVLTLGTRRPSEQGEPQSSLLESYAQRIAIALANAQILESDRILDVEAEASARRLAFQSRISALFAGSLDSENTLGRLMKLVTMSFADSAAIFAVEQPTQRIRLIVAASKTADLTNFITQYYADYPPLVDDVIGTGRACRMADMQFLDADLLAAGGKLQFADRQRKLIAEWAPVSVLSLPLLMRGVVAGVLTLIRDRSKQSFDATDADVAQEIGRRTAAYMENARLYERQLGIASVLQRALLPPEFPAVPELLFAVRYFAGADGMDVGGDWYDIVNVGPDRMVVTIGDVVGRGIKAAVAMGQYRDMLRAYAFEGFGPAAALSRLNDVLHALGGEAFATCTVVVLDRVTRRIVYASAGHPPLMLRLLDGTVRVLDGARSMPIGAWPETRYIEAACDMPIGATLLFYTDGLVETRHRSAAEGVELLAAALSRSRPDIELMLEDVLHDIAPDRSDDIAILAIEMLVPQSETLRRWVFPAIDRATVHAIEAEFDTIFERRHIAGAEAFGARTVLGELLSNVARHAPGAFRLELNWGGEFPELSLYDSGPGFAPPAQFLGPADILSTTGRGLFLVAQTSRSVKMARRPSGGLATNVVLAICQKPHARQLAPSVSGEGGEAQNAGREMPRT